MLYSFEKDISDAELERRLHSQEVTEGNHTAHNVYNNVRRMMEALPTDRPMDLFTRRSATRPTRYAVEDFIDAPGADGAPKAAATKLTYLHSLASVSNPYKKGTARFAAEVPTVARKRFAKLASKHEQAVRKSRGGRLDNDELSRILPWEDVQRGYRLKRASLPNDQAKLIADLYLGSFAPKRLDYGRVRVYGAGTTANERTEANHVVVNPATGSVRMILNDFKTSKFKGPSDELLPKKLASQIIESLGGSDPKSWRAWLLYRHGSDGRQPMTSNSLGAALTDVTRRLTGRPISICGLRKSFVTHVHGICDTKQLEKIASSMGHSLRTAKTHYKISNIKNSLNVANAT